MRKTRILLLIGTIALIFFSCDKDEINQKKLIGMWIENGLCSDGICDTIVFKENNKVELYYPFIDWTYRIHSNDSITFINQSGVTKGFNFLLTENNTLIIYNFIDKSITNEIKDIEFTKE